MGFGIHRTQATEWAHCAKPVKRCCATEIDPDRYHPADIYYMIFLYADTLGIDKCQGSIDRELSGDNKIEGFIQTMIRCNRAMVID